MIQQEKEFSQEKRQKQRRAILKRGIGATVAVAGVGTVTAFQSTAGTAHANGAEGPTQFSGSSDPVVSVHNTNTNGSMVTIGGSPHGITCTSGPSGVAILGKATNVNGVVGVSTSAGGVVGISTSSDGVAGFSTSGDGVSGNSTSAHGVIGLSESGPGIFGQSVSADAVVAQARPITPTDHPTALHVLGTIKVEADGNGRDNPVGTATLAAGATSVTVSNPVATPQSIVLLTPQGNPGGMVWVTTAAGTFTIHRAGVFLLLPQVTFAYLIIN